MLIDPCCIRSAAWYACVYVPFLIESLQHTQVAFFFLLQVTSVRSLCVGHFYPTSFFFAGPLPCSILSLLIHSACMHPQLHACFCVTSVWHRGSTRPRLQYCKNIKVTKIDYPFMLHLVCMADKSSISKLGFLSTSGTVDTSFFSLRVTQKVDILIKTWGMS